MDTKGGDARECIQGHYYLPLLVHGFCFEQVSRSVVWHIDVLKTPSGTIDIGLIRDEYNELAPTEVPV